MSDLLKIIKAGTKNKTTVNFPRSEKKIEVHLLSNEDTLQSTADAEKLFKQLGITVEFHNVNAWENERAIQMLYRSIKDPENGQPVAPDISSFRALTTNEDRRDLMDAYNALVEECNPSPFNMDPHEFDAFIESVKKNPETTIGNCSGLVTLRKLALFLVNVQKSSPTDNGPTS